MRLINQTFAFGCRGTGGAAWRGAARRKKRGAGGETGGSAGQAGSSTRPSRAERSRAGPGRAKPGSAAAHRAEPGQAATSVSPTAAHPRVVISLARYFCVALARAVVLSLAPACLCLARSSFSVCLPLLACLPACLCLSVARVPPAPLPGPLFRLSRAVSPCLSPGSAMYRWHGESTHQSADCGLLNARSHDPASGDVYTG